MSKELAELNESILGLVRRVCVLEKNSEIHTEKLKKEGERDQAVDHLEERVAGRGVVDSGDTMITARELAHLLEGEREVVNDAIRSLRQEINSLKARADEAVRSREEIKAKLEYSKVLLEWSGMICEEWTLRNDL